jgi:hypothetical protein
MSFDMLTVAVLEQNVREAVLAIAGGAADPNARRSGTPTLLEFACLGCRGLPCADVLLQGGANPRNWYREPPLMNLARTARFPRTNTRDEDDFNGIIYTRYFDKLALKMLRLDAEIDGEGLLHNAIVGNLVETVRHLLQQGMSANVPHHLYGTCLDYSMESGFSEMSRVLREFGATPKDPDRPNDLGSSLEELTGRG